MDDRPQEAKTRLLPSRRPRALGGRARPAEAHASRLPRAALVVVILAAACTGPGADPGTTLPPATPAPGTVPLATSTVAATTTAPAPTTSATGPEVAAIVADHLATGPGSIPAEWRERAVDTVVWAYGSTSHGTQLWAGAEALGPGYPFARQWRAVPSPSALRMAYDDAWAWDPTAFYQAAVALLADAPQANVFSWAWCGELSWDTTAAAAYLDAMARLEAAYPGVTFVYMTGHTDGPADQILEENNQAIRDHVLARGGVLFDFADIESWDPAGTYYPDTDDSCPWCSDWCATHDCATLLSECAHSHPFSCVLKGRALWWLSARLAGWDGS